MKAFLYLLTISIIVSALNYGCETTNPQMVINGKLISKSDCKSNGASIIDSEMNDTLSCIEYQYEPILRTLTIKHINAGFNCCPGEIKCTAKLQNDTIILTESETQAMCECDCLFDLNIEISGLESKVYQIKVIEPYCGVQEKLNFTLKLTNNIPGVVCVTRKMYPWGMSQH